MTMVLQILVAISIIFIFGMIFILIHKPTDDTIRQYVSFVWDQLRGVR